MDRHLGFTPQHVRDGACGKYALQYALLLLGTPVSQRDASKATGLSPSKTKQRGTNERRLLRGIRNFGFTPRALEVNDASSARTRLDAFLDMGWPVIMNVQKGAHWIVIGGRHGANYVWFDSATEKVLGSGPWKKLVAWSNTPWIYFIAVAPRRENDLGHSLVARIALVQRLMHDQHTRMAWGDMLQVLRRAFNTPPLNVPLVTPARYFTLHHAMIVDAVRHAQPKVKEEAVRGVIRRIRSVAVAHNLLVADTQRAAATAHIVAWIGRQLKR